MSCKFGVVTGIKKKNLQFRFFFKLKNLRSYRRLYAFATICLRRGIRMNKHTAFVGPSRPVTKRTNADDKNFFSWSVRRTNEQTNDRLISSSFVVHDSRGRRRRRRCRSIFCLLMGSTRMYVVDRQTKRKLSRSVGANISQGTFLSSFSFQIERERFKQKPKNRLSILQTSQQLRRVRASRCRCRCRRRCMRVLYSFVSYDTKNERAIFYLNGRRHVAVRDKNATETSSEAKHCIESVATTSVRISKH